MTTALGAGETCEDLSLWGRVVSTTMDVIF